MQISQITDTLESFAPIALQESFDNCGLLVGNPQCEATGVLLCIDVVENIVDEAIASGCNLIVAHHPLIFRGIKKLNGKNYIERCIEKAVKNDVAIYAAHINFDITRCGVSHKMAKLLNLHNIRILSPKKNILALARLVGRFEGRLADRELGRAAAARVLRAGDLDLRPADVLVLDEGLELGRAHEGVVEGGRGADVLGVLPVEALALLSGGGQDREPPLPVVVLAPAVGQGEDGLRTGRIEVVDVAGDHIDPSALGGLHNELAVPLVGGSARGGYVLEVGTAGDGGLPQLLVRFRGAPAGALVLAVTGEGVGADNSGPLGPGGIGGLAGVGLDEHVSGDDVVAPVEQVEGVGAGIRGPLLLGLVSGDVVGGHRRDLVIRVHIGDDELVLIADEHRSLVDIHLPGPVGALRPAVGGGGGSVRGVPAQQAQPQHDRAADDEDGDENDDGDDDGP